MNNDYTQAELYEIIYAHAEWLRDLHTGERADLSNKRLRGVNLPCVDFRKAYLRGADLREADLRGAGLCEADLNAADLRGADLREADLQGSNLTSADLREAYLRGAYLRGADLREADLQGSDLSSADLREADLRSADLTQATLYGADLSGADLRGVAFCGANLYAVKGNILALGPLGKRNRLTYAYSHDNIVYVRCGCFEGTLAAFAAKVAETHHGNEHEAAYNAAIEFIRTIAKLRWGIASC